MPLSKTELEALMRLVGLTKDEATNCEQCLALVADFAEQKLAGTSIPEGLHALGQHLSVGAECREEYEALVRAVNRSRHGWRASRRIFTPSHDSANRLLNTIP